jgi:DNA-binding NarL/FixJ family response regulator
MLPNQEELMNMQKSNPPTIVHKLLIVDDHVLFLEGLISLFSAYPDFQIVGKASSVYEAIELAEKLDPDIVLTDFYLPDGTGLDATKAILARHPDCKIVFLTISETDEDLLSAIRMGATGYLLKNLAGADLITSLRALQNDEMALSRKMMGRIAREYAKANKFTTSSWKILAELTPREVDVLSELQTGAPNSEIARRLFLSENTVKHHIRNVLSKLGVKNRREAIIIANQAGIKSKLSKT